MKKILVIIAVFFAVLLVLVLTGFEKQEPKLLIETANVPVQYVGKVSLNDRMKVRILILKHCRERLADNEGQALVQAANLAQSKGLSIKDIGNHHVDKDGLVNQLVWGAEMDITKLKEFVDQQMKIDAEPYDTLVIYTTGHGSPSGTVQILGSRYDLGMAFAECAESNNQETVWWQSSCYAASGLPKMSELSEKQQKLFSMVASSSANSVSYWGDQPPRMKTTFLALAEGGTNIDPDQDGVVTAGELSHFFATEAKSRTNGKLIARSEDEPIFGWFDIANSLPIRLPDGRIIDCPDDFVPYPRNRY